MAYVTYRGTNASLTLHGTRFEPKVPVLIESEAVLKKLRDQADFEIREEKVIPLEDLTLVQLKDKAKVAGIEGFSDLKKQELVDALNAHEGKGQSNVDPNDPPTT
ncbi:hypothetical protein PMSD_14880 [Paenibacillus macquariensis subsp. defensor]|nr:hypothetical protein PMSD_14880 [Paenibacillus macquariensis subsp. defensor]